MPRSPMLLLMAALATSSAACGPAAHLARPITADPVGEAETSRAALSALRRHRFAEGVDVELSRVDAWLSDADRNIASGDADSDDNQLLLLAVRIQLSEIKSYYLRREAEETLDDAREERDRRQSELRALETLPAD